MILYGMLKENNELVFYSPEVFNLLLTFYNFTMKEFFKSGIKLRDMNTDNISVIQ